MNKKTLKIILLLWLFILSSFAIIQNTVYALVPASNTVYQGIDVSAYQGKINYELVKQAGIDIVYIKASEGNYLEDPEFRTNYEDAKNAGLNIGFYHFVRARNEQEAREEAEFFANIISDTEPNCRLAMDFEVFGDLSINAINAISKAFLEKTQELTGKEMVVYSNTYDAINIFDATIANQYPLWVAQYGVSEPSDNGKWNNWIGFQYSDRGRVLGINGNVDLDRFTKEIFLSNIEQVPVPINQNLEEIKNVIHYTVKRGDTLLKIAREYDTTVEHLVDVNNIRNPNLIFTGQILEIPILNNNNNTNVASSISTEYTVKRGDNLYNISRRFGTTINSIVNLNNISNPNLIYPGQRLLIRRDVRANDTHAAGSTFYRVGRGDNLTYIARRYHTTVAKIVQLNNITNPNLIFPGQILRISNQ